VYTDPHLVPPLPLIPHGEIHLSLEQQCSVRGICETRMWRVHEIAQSITSRPLVVHALPAFVPARHATVAHIEYNSPPSNQGSTQIRTRTNLGSSVTCREPPLLRVLRAAYFVFCSIFITTFVFSDSLCTYVTAPIDTYIALPICLSSSSVYIYIRVIHAYVYVNSYMHFPTYIHARRGTSKSASVYLHFPVHIFNLTHVSIAPYLHAPITLYSCVFISQFLYVHICLFLQQSVPTLYT